MSSWREEWSTGAMRASLALWLAVVGVNCTGDANVSQTTQDLTAAGITSAASTAAVTSTTLNTFVNSSLEIDQLGAAPPDDANLFVGADPADGTASRSFPLGGPSSFIDWNDLGNDLTNHRFLDLDNPATGRDDTAFPRSNECIAPANVLKKMDLTYVAAANNLQYTYLGVQRAANNGDAGYYWVFTQRSPRLVAGQSPCNAGEQRLVYDITGPSGTGGTGTGDILVVGHFHPSSLALVQVFTAVATRNNVGAVSAINYLDTSLWTPASAGATAAAVNTTRTAPGSFGAAGVISTTGANLGPEIFAEAAVPLSVFTGGSPCGASYFGMVITRSSGSGGTSPDLKDVAGPAIFNFGRTEARPTLSPTCGAAFNYAGAGTRPDGSPVPTPSCQWTFSNGATSNNCNGSVAGLPPGTYTGTLTITDPETSCTASQGSASVNVYAPLAVSANLTQACSASFGYDAVVTGGSAPGGVRYAWSFSGGGTVDPAASVTRSGTVNVGTPGAEYTGTIVVTDPRTDIACTATASATVTPSPINVAARLTPSCDAAFGFEAGATAPDGSPVAGATCAWTFSNGTTSNICNGTLTGLAPGSYTGTVVVRNPATGCTRTFTTPAITVYAPLSATASLAGTCASTFSYDVAVNGGSNPAALTYAWSFTGGGTATPATSTSRSGSVTAGTAGVAYTGSVVVTDVREGITCTVTATGSATPHRIRALGALSPTCRQAFGYQGSGTGSDGGALVNPTCTWTFDNGATATGCSGELSAPVGARTGTVTVTDAATGCSDTAVTAPVSVYAPLAAVAAVAPSCSAFTYDVAVTGGSNPSGVSYAWAFSGGGAVTPASSTTRNGAVTVGTAGVAYTASVVVTDPRTDIVCTATATGSATAHRTSATARLTPTCGLSFGFEAAGTNAAGAALTGATCAWTFDNGATSTSCAGNAAAAAGAHTGTVTVTDPATGCSNTVTTAAVNVYAPLAVAADLNATCSSFTYDAAVTGGSNPSTVSYAWTFTGGGTVDPATSTLRNGSITAGTAGVAYTGTVVVTDARTDITCTATSNDSATPHRTSAAARLTPTCGLSFGFEASGTNAAGGALTGATCAWTFDNGATSTSCAGNAAAAAGAHTGTVTVTDPATGCSNTVTTAAVDVYPPLEAAAVVAPRCSSFAYDVNVTGGSNPTGVSYAWTFTGGGTVDPAASTTRNGTVATGTAGVAYTASVVVTDPRTDIVCTATATGGATPDRTTGAARLTPTCGLTFGYEAGANDAEGNPIPDATCAWTFDNGTTSTDCNGTAAAAAGTHTGTVVITDPTTGCTDTRTVAPVAVHPPLAITADLTATCSGTFGYVAAVTGGSNAAGTAVAWTFTGGGTVTPASSTSRTGTASVGTPGVAYTGVVSATDPRTDITCSATASDSATPFLPITVSLAPAASPQSCPSISTDAVTYVATVAGGNGAYAFTWDGATCAGTSCTIAPPPGTFCHTQTLHVTVSDTSGLCPAAVSENETYSKVTVISASNN